MKNENTPKSFLQRMYTYSLEMFPVHIYLPYVVALYVCMNFITQVVAGSDIIIDIYSIVGMLTAFFIMLEMRTFDDLKDIEIDRDLFPERATPRGAVLKSDISIISISCFLILVATNAIWGHKTIILFIIMMVYALLTFKWFFAEKIHRKNLFLTMATHQPLPIMINFFLIHTALASGEVYEAFSFHHVLILLIFSLPVTAWETSRKIRAVGHETEYETFSMIFGTRPATWIPFTCLILALSLGIYIGSLLEFHWAYHLIMAGLGLYIGFFYIRFLRFPKKEYNVLKNVTMVFTTALFFSMLIFILLNHAVQFNF